MDRLTRDDMLTVDQYGQVLFGDMEIGWITTGECIDEINSLLSYRGSRKLRQDTADLWEAIIWIFAQTRPPMTVRQMFYALVSNGAIEKSEKAYNRVKYHILKMRRMGIVPYTFIADNTRWMRKPNTYEGLDQFLEITKQTYRRMLWANQKSNVEVWCEKDALAGVLYEITSVWDVPLMVTRGFPSDSFLYEAAEAIKAEDNQTWVYYFGDYDPSGDKIAVSTERKLREFGAFFHFEVVAVLPWQIRALNLPTRPTKKSTHSKGWEGGSVELDAIPVDRLRDLCRESIEVHIDQSEFERTKEIEEKERKTLEEFHASLA